MPRPHAFPRRRETPSALPFPPYRPEDAPSRAFACVNVHRADKSVFDALQSYLSYERGRSVQQWETFAVTLRLALAEPRPRELAGFELPPWALQLQPPLAGK